MLDRVLISRPEVLISRPEVLISRPEVLISRPQVLISRPQVLISRPHGTTMSAEGDFQVTDTSILRDVPLFKNLDQNYLKNIASMFSTEHIPAGRTVINEGDEGSRFYIIVRGKVAVSAANDEDVVQIATLEDGDYFGEISLLANIPTTATVTTLTPGIFITLRREQLNRLVHQYAGLGAQMREALEHRLAQTYALTD